MNDEGMASEVSQEVSTEETRLMIPKIVCENFKSYAGIRELGPFHKCFSSIVGPNGSGKSNVIDAMLFVFGYRAKKIRSKSISVLIHNSEHHQNIQSCSVSVHFQKIVDLHGEDYKVVPGSQFVVSRTAYKDNTSHYQLNGRKVPFKEVALLLRENGIDLDHNRFLILQGEVEQIALMKPKALTEHDEGMLEFLEDIIGTSQYKEPIDELGKKVEELNENRGEKLNRVKAVEKEKNELEGAKNEAEEYLVMKREVTLKQCTLYERYKYECSQLETKAKEKKEELETKVKEIKESVKRHKEEKESKIKQQKKLYKMYEQYTQKNEKCKSSLSTCEQRDTLVRQDLKNTKVQLKKTNKTLEKEKEKLTELETTPEKYTKEILECEKKLKILEKRKIEEEERLSEVMASLKKDTQGLQDEKEVLENQLVGLSQAVNKTKSKLDVAIAELELYKERFTAGEKQLQQAKEEIKNVAHSLKEKQSDLKKYENLLPTKRQELACSEKELEEVTKEMEVIGQSLRSSRGQVEEARSALQAHKSRGQVLDAIMQQRDSGNITGICGRLGDLGSIDDKYDVAISTACGPLDNVVVDNMETAIKCVEFLKSTKLGSASFIGLDKVEVWRKKATTKMSTPEGVPRLFDLVKVRDDKYLTAFYFALKNTLVAKDLEQATRIGLQGNTRHRVVTLGGQLIDSAGTMSGGGNKVTRGRMSSKSLVDVSPTQLVQLEDKLKIDESKAEEYQHKRAELERKVRTLQSDITEAEKEIKRLQRDIQLLKTQEKGLNERINELKIQNAETQIDQGQLAKLEKQVKTDEKGYEKASMAANDIERQVKSLHEEIMRIGGLRMKSQQDQVDKVKNAIKDASATITKNNVAIKTAERNTKKTRDKVGSLENDITTAENHLEELQTELKNLEEEAKSIIQEQEIVHANLKELEGQLTSLKAEIEIIETKEREVDEQLLDLTHELEQYVSKVKENRQKIKHFENEINKLGLEKEDKRELTEEELTSLDKKDVEYQITMLEEALKQKMPNMAAIDEYKRKEVLHKERLQELDTITVDRDTARGNYESLRKKRLDEFMAGFSVITSKLKEMYQMITLGGDAELELVDSLDPFSEGIVFSVRPPKKSWKNISNLSGGEKTLSSLALVFALHHYKPSPLYVMDEIDAALDFKNVSIVANYIKERTKNAQFIIISLRNNMFELADHLVGIYKTDNCTKSVTINPRKMGQKPLSSPPMEVSSEA